MSPGQYQNYAVVSVEIVTTDVLGTNTYTLPSQCTGFFAGFYAPFGKENQTVFILLITGANSLQVLSLDYYDIVNVVIRHITHSCNIVYTDIPSSQKAAILKLNSYLNALEDEEAVFPGTDLIDIECYDAPQEIIDNIRELNNNPIKNSTYDRGKILGQGILSPKNSNKYNNFNANSHFKYTEPKVQCIERKRPLLSEEERKTMFG